MRKTFSLTAVGKANARVVESVKHEVRKYVKRERAKQLPPQSDAWEFVCKVGSDSQSAERKPLREVGAAIDAIASTGANQVYLEVLAIPARRSSAGVTAMAPSTPPPSSDTEP